MSIIVITGALRDQLLANEGEAELRDESGSLIGRFLPPSAPELDMTDAEIAAQLAPGITTYSTAEVLAHVKGLAS